MDRRTVLRYGGFATSGLLAGCLGALRRGTNAEPPLVEDRPQAVYYPTHADEMAMVGMGTLQRRAVAVMYTYPHRFWTVTGTRTEQVAVAEDDTVHLMVTVWDTETGTVLPVESGVRIAISQDGESVDERAPWPMLSQPMGFHYGDNIALPGDGAYTVSVDLGSMGLERRGTFAGQFGSPGTVDVEFEYQRADREALEFRSLADRQGERGAVSPMAMGEMPLSTAPRNADLPGRVIGETTSGDAVFIATVTEVDDGAYLAVSPRTPHNRYVLPMMSLSGRLEREGSQLFEGPLTPALDPARNYHYGATLEGVAAGDELTIAIDAPPQVSRHEGYETAFLEIPAVTMTVP